jgi:hypothetical protein
MGLFNCAYLCPLPPVLCLLKPIAHVCAPKMAEDELSAYPASSKSMVCPEPCNKPPFSAFTISPFAPYLAFRGGWPDLAYGIAGVWVLVQNSGFNFILPTWFGLLSSLKCISKTSRTYSCHAFHNTIML